MSEPENLIICSATSDRIMGAINALMPQLAVDVREQLDMIKLLYWQRYGFEGLFDRTNNRSVATILAEFNWADLPSPIASGELDGVKYELFDAPAVDDETTNPDST